MRAMFQRSFSISLYTVVGLLLLVNVVSLLTGSYLALIPLGLQLLVLASVYLHKAWAYIVVRIWAVLLVLAGASMWLAVLFGGTSYFHSAGHAVAYTLVLVLGVYFFIYSKPVLRANGATI